jgi:hypothetical protein
MRSGTLMWGVSGVLLLYTMFLPAVYAQAMLKVHMKQQPSTTTPAGAVFAIQPQINSTDAAGLLATEPFKVTADFGRYWWPSGRPQHPSTNPITSVGGIATFTDLSFSEAQSNIRFFFECQETTPGASQQKRGVYSGFFNVTARPATVLRLDRQASTTSPAGAPFAIQPQISAKDPWGNAMNVMPHYVHPSYVERIPPSTAEYGNAPSEEVVVTATLTGAGPLLGTTTSMSANGISTFTNLRIDVEGIGYVLTFTSGNVPYVSVSGTAFNITTPGTTPCTNPATNSATTLAPTLEKKEVDPGSKSISTAAVVTFSVAATGTLIWFVWVKATAIVV